MSKIKIVLLCLVIPFFVFIACTFLKILKHEEYRQKIILAHDIRKVLGILMVDLEQAHESTIIGAPADGLWHHGIVINRGRMVDDLRYTVKEGHLLFRTGEGKVSLIADDIYDLGLRRQKTDPDLLEIKIEARKNAALTYNLRIRMSGY